MSSPALSEWQVESLRFTAFTRDAISPGQSDTWWRSVADTTPESVTNKPSLGTFSTDGPVDGARLVLNIAPGRLDWLAVPNLEGLTVPSLGRLLERDNQFAERLSEWLHLPSISMYRIGYGGVAQFPVATRVAGYKVLAELLSDFRIDPETSHDFMYQINRPRVSQVIPGLRINRLIKWGVAELQFLEVRTRATVPSHHFVRVEFDINTDKNSEQELKDVPALCSELRRLAQEIIERGDIR